MIAFFDVDKTLCDGYCGYYTTRDLIERGIIKKRRLLKAVLYKTIGRIFKQMNVRHMYEIALADMAGTHQDEIMAIGNEVFLTQVKPRLYVDGLKTLKELKNKGYKIVLISSGPTMCVRNMEKFLEADFSYSNGPVVKDGILQRVVQEPLVYKEGKLLLAETIIRENQTDFKDCYFFTDSYSDLPLLEKVGKPRVVNPDRHLKKVAHQKGWPILKFAQTLGS